MLCWRTYVLVTLICTTVCFAQRMKTSCAPALPGTVRDEPEDIAYVNTAEELQWHVGNHTKFIIITQDLDLTHLPRTTRTLDCGVLDVSATVAIRGACGQNSDELCTLELHEDGIEARREEGEGRLDSFDSGKLWLSRLALRQRDPQTTGRELEHGAFLLVRNREVWLTDVVLEGHPATEKVRAIDVEKGSRLVMHGGVINNFREPSQAPAFRLQDNATATFEGVQFMNSHLMKPVAPNSVRNGQVLQGTYGPLAHLRVGSSAALNKCTFAHITVQGQDVSSFSPQQPKYSVEASAVVSENESPALVFDSVTGALRRSRSTPPSMSLPSTSDQWFLSVQNRLDKLMAAESARGYTPASESSDLAMGSTGLSGVALPVIIGASLGLAAVLLLLCVFMWIRRRQRHRQQNEQILATEAKPPGPLDAHSAPNKRSTKFLLDSGNASPGAQHPPSAPDLSKPAHPHALPHDRDPLEGGSNGTIQWSDFPEHPFTRSNMRHSTNTPSSPTESTTPAPNPRPAPHPTQDPHQLRRSSGRASAPAPQFPPQSWQPLSRDEKKNLPSSPAVHPGPKSGARHDPAPPAAAAYQPPPPRSSGSARGGGAGQHVMEAGIGDVEDKGHNTHGGKLEQALDALAETGQLLFGRFIVRGVQDRRVGGQGIVQFAQDIQTQEQYAIKFFTRRVGFERERKLYDKKALRSMMPAVFDVIPNNDSRWLTPEGASFPPCIVVERGESLDEWARRIEPGFPTILNVLCDVATRLQQLHAAGYVHRDLKPGNILWRPTQFSWTLIDFGCTAVIGHTVGLSFSLLYAPPEVIHAVERNDKHMVADPKIDMWAMGVIAYELLTRTRIFSPALSKSQVRDRIAGREKLPWEDPVARKEGHKQLRILKPTVLACLSRDPEKRPTADRLLRSWNRIFDTFTSGSEQVGTTTNYLAGRQGQGSAT